MKAPASFFMLLVINEMSATVMQRPPTFATLMFSDSYLPATMQVIFYAVEQLRHLQLEENEYNSNILISSSASPPGLTTWQTISKALEDIEFTTFAPEISTKYQSTITTKMLEVKNKNLRFNSETSKATQVMLNTHSGKSDVVRQNHFKVENIMETLSDSSDVQVRSETFKLSDLFSSYKNTSPLNKVIFKKRNSDGNKIFLMQDNLGGEEKETRFTLLGERVTKEPRPSLISYLKLSAMPLRASLQQLASLYDVLNKDAKKQGLAKYAGYSDEVLNILETSVGGGIGPQLKHILENTLERNELTREDSKVQAQEVLLKLKDSGSRLSTDLRHLFPLRYVP
ncbi:uncharacterized protein LOC117171995 [Belonocnema kinseyi]|uniref:uncharacterized protein LOC117171995 n=1 Tax=Belonocnema kinseyi TaxID=2817044 RepID=UPI00143DED55|nr:uncharacterized protein LOC117171995 [Belonocnema kinseyi]